MILDSDEIWTQLTRYVQSEATLERLTGETANDSGDNHPNVDWAHEQAEDEMRGVIEGVAEWPLDTWTPSLVRVLCAITIDNVTTGADRRPEWIAKRREWADSVLSDIKTGKRKVRDTDEDTSAGSRISTSTIQQRTPVFDVNDEESPLMLRRPPL